MVGGKEVVWCGHWWRSSQSRGIRHGCNVVPKRVDVAVNISDQHTKVLAREDRDLDPEGRPKKGCWALEANGGEDEFQKREGIEGVRSFSQSLKLLTEYDDCCWQVTL